tara:strand:+ start:453 stop:1580 length:1128 start_codon:yes stop_codon:yes gene_type:complete
MTNLLTQGIEIETAGVSIAQIKTAFENASIKGASVVHDGTPSVDAEIILPPLCLFNMDGTPCQVAYEYLTSVCRVLNRLGCRINSNCGLHVHVGIYPLEVDQPSHQWTADSIAKKERTGRYYTGGLELEPINAVVWYDVLYRYSRQQQLINRILPPSRTNNRYCYPINLNNFDNLHANNATIESIKQLTRGKFSVINFETWSRGTVEFRQHSGTIEAEKIIAWCKLIRTIVNWSITDRVENGTGSTTETTPENPFRAGSRVGVQYSLMRRLAGATTREIMDATGCSEQRVRAAVSEIRNRIGHSAVVTNTMQANGRRYGDGTDFTSYEILHEITVENTGAVMIPENRIGNASIWSNVDDDDFEYWQARTSELYPN